ncbi:hypothetical protein, partial [Burkholderia cenocepacia]|uniref:hypothetical protein n=1 Tax=Burkholderia cenocepacia TaxID=95486 RepID=UPI003D2254E0
AREQFVRIRERGAHAAVRMLDDVRHRVVFTLELDVVEHPDGRVSAAFSYADELLARDFVVVQLDERLDEIAR